MFNNPIHVEDFGSNEILTVAKRNAAFDIS